jgi:hypothetical protein
MRQGWTLILGLSIALGCGGRSSGSDSGSETADGSDGDGDDGSGGDDGSSGDDGSGGDGSGDDGGSSGDDGGTSSGGPCDDYEGLAPPDVIALTPRENTEAEQLAIEGSGELVAPEAVYERVVDDLASIRQDFPEVASISAMPSWHMSSFILSLDEEAQALYAADDYHEWDCPNELYVLTAIEDFGLDYLLLRFGEKRYGIPLLMEEYLALEHVTYTEPNGFGGDGPDVCLSIDGDTHVYIFDDASGDCPAGCIDHLYRGFSVDASGQITPLGEEQNPASPPPWWDDACASWL